MKKLGLFFLFLLIFASGCKSDENKTEASIMGTWQYLKEENYTNGKKIEDDEPISDEEKKCLAKETRTFNREGQYIPHFYYYDEDKDNDKCEDLGQQDFPYSISGNKVIIDYGGGTTDEKVFEVTATTLILKEFYDETDEDGNKTGNKSEIHYYFKRK